MNQNKKHATPRNVRILYVLSICIGLVFWYGVEKIFLTRTLHLGPEFVAWMVTTYALIQVLFNVPAGVLADRWSRKGTLVIALLLFMLATTVLGLSHSGSLYIVGTFIWGLYLVCLTGTDESLLYDSLRDAGAEADYKKYYGRTQAFFMLGIFVSSSVSGLVVRAFGIRSAFFLTLPALAVGLLSGLLLTEPQSHRQQQSASALLHLRESLSAIRANLVLRQIVLMSMIGFLVMTAFYEYAQFYYIGLFAGNAIWVGVSNGLGGLSVGLGNLITKQLRFDGYGFALMAVLLGGAMLPVPHLVAFTSFLCFALVFGATMANISEIKHQHTESHVRATVSSAISMANYAIIVPLSFLFSRLVAQRSIIAGYTVVAVMSALYFVYYLWRVRRIIKPSVGIATTLTEE